jgi:hypothetical protein
VAGFSLISSWVISFASSAIAGNNWFGISFGLPTFSLAQKLLHRDQTGKRPPCHNGS